MSSPAAFNAQLRLRRKQAGYTSASDAWAALRAVYDETPSLATFTRWESEPNAEATADAATIEIYCREILKCSPYDLSVKMGDRCAQLLQLLVGNPKPGDSPPSSTGTRRYPRRLRHPQHVDTSEREFEPALA